MTKLSFIPVGLCFLFADEICPRRRPGLYLLSERSRSWLASWL